MNTLIITKSLARFGAAGLFAISALFWREDFPAFYQWFIAGTQRAVY